MGMAEEICQGETGRGGWRYPCNVRESGRRETGLRHAGRGVVA
jgi:hypothetical protein